MAVQNDKLNKTKLTIVSKQKQKGSQDKEVIRAAKRSEIEITKTGHKKRYIVSSVVEGAPIDYGFLQAMELFAQHNNAEIVLLWMRGVYKNDQFSLDEVDALRKYLASEYRFNTKLLAKSFLVHPAHKFPVTGLEEYAQDNDSLICASTKQCLELVARPRGKVPHTIHTTGTISIPKYSKTRTGCIAAKDNKLGALVIEVVDSKNFFIRQVQWINGAFVDLGKKYTKDSVKSVECKAMVLGDLHLTEEDASALEATYDQIKKLKPENVFLHDILSNNSINHHELGKCVSRCTLPKEFDTLEKEFKYGKAKLTEIRNKIHKDTNIYVVASNHDDFIKKWCDTGEFVKDAQNAVIGAKCFIALTEQKNPLELFLDVKGVTYLKQDSSFKIEGFECAEHGHLGTNGARGSAKSYIKSHGKAFIGHSHTPKIVSNIWQVGTLSKLTLGYTHGASSWMHANGVIYKGGYAQMILFINKDWCVWHS